MYVVVLKQSSSKKIVYLSNQSDKNQSPALFFFSAFVGEISNDVNGPFFVCGAGELLGFVILLVLLYKKR